MNLLDLIKFGIDFILHIDAHLAEIIHAAGIWSYLVLFGIIFVETGVVIMPFLPGDSLLFAAGALSSITIIDPLILYVVVAIAAVLGDTCNYWIGHTIGPRAFSGEIRFLKKEYMDKTQAFYEKHGGKTIFLARFVPIVRTFAPFVAGIGHMRYSYFLTYNVVGGLVWTGSFIALGHFFGNLPFVEENFSLVVIAIIIISVLPAVVEYLRERGKTETEPQTVTETN